MSLSPIEVGVYQFILDDQATEIELARSSVGCATTEGVLSSWIDGEWIAGYTSKEIEDACESLVLKGHLEVNLIDGGRYFRTPGFKARVESFILSGRSPEPSFSAGR